MQHYNMQQILKKLWQYRKQSRLGWLSAEKPINSASWKMQESGAKNELLEELWVGDHLLWQRDGQHLVFRSCRVEARS